MLLRRRRHRIMQDVLEQSLQDANFEVDSRGAKSVLSNFVQASRQQLTKQLEDAFIVFVANTIQEVGRERRNSLLFRHPGMPGMATPSRFFRRSRSKWVTVQYFVRSSTFMVDVGRGFSPASKVKLGDFSYLGVEPLVSDFTFKDPKKSAKSLSRQSLSAAVDPNEVRFRIGLAKETVFLCCQDLRSSFERVGMRRRLFVRFEFEDEASDGSDNDDDQFPVTGSSSSDMQRRGSRSSFSGRRRFRWCCGQRQAAADDRGAASSYAVGATAPAAARSTPSAPSIRRRRRPVESVIFFFFRVSVIYEEDLPSLEEDDDDGVGDAQSFEMPARSSMDDGFSGNLVAAPSMDSAGPGTTTIGQGVHADACLPLALDVDEDAWIKRFLLLGQSKASSD